MIRRALSSAGGTGSSGTTPQYSVLALELRCACGVVSCSRSRIPHQSVGLSLPRLIEP